MTRDPLNEDQLRAALRAEAAGVDPDDDASLATIRRRGRAAIVRRRVVLGSVLGTLVLVAGAALVLPQLGDEDGTVIVEPGPDDTTTTTTPPEPTTTATTPTAPSQVDETPYLWPPPDHEQYTESLDAARSFVTDYVGFPNPQFGAVREAEPRLVEIDVLALGEDGQPFGGRVWSTLQVSQAADGTWRVRSAHSEMVVIDGFDATDTSVTVRGRGNGFEGTINAYAVAADGGRLGDPAIITVNCCESLEPFEVTIGVPDLPASLLVVSATGLDGGSDFAAVPLVFGGGQADVLAYFVGPDGTVQPVARRVPTPAVLGGALTALFDGPTDTETAAGFSTALPANAGDYDPTATIADGVATVDIPVGIAQPDPDQPGQTLPPDQAQLMVEQLYRTVFQFENISQVQFTLSGSCDDFGRWIGQRGTCLYDRALLEGEN